MIVILVCEFDEGINDFHDEVIVVAIRSEAEIVFVAIEVVVLN